jgi:hypothetical protein
MKQGGPKQRSANGRGNSRRIDHAFHEPSQTLEAPSYAAGIGASGAGSGYSMRAAHFRADELVELWHRIETWVGTLRAPRDHGRTMTSSL